MPIIHVHSQAAAPSTEALRSITHMVEGVFGWRCWLLWHVVDASDDVNRGPVVLVTCKDVHDHNQVTKMTAIVRSRIAAIAEIDSSEVFLAVQRVRKEEVFDTVSGARDAGDMWIVEPIGYVRNYKHELVDEGWGTVESVIELDSSRFGADAVAGLEEFSHLEILSLLHLVSLESIVTGARHPRGDEDLPLVGIFAQRAKHRPNRLGVSTCELLRVETGPRLVVVGLDAVDGTPILDIKPYVREFAPRTETRQPKWSHVIMKNYF